MNENDKSPSPEESAAKKPKKPAKNNEGETLARLERHLEDFASGMEARIEGLANAVTATAKLADDTARLLKNVIDASDHKPRPVAREPERPAYAPMPPAQDADLSRFFPPQWRAVIDRELGPDFDASVDPSAGGDWTLNVYSPPQWDTRRGDEKSFSPRDRRCGLVRRGSDLADVENWCKRFAANIRQTYPHFGPQTAQNFPR